MNELPPSTRKPEASAPVPCSASTDRRTRSGRKKEILDHIHFHGGFSIFWVTEHYLRAVVATEMQNTGEIVTDNKTYGYPWIGAKIAKQNAIAQTPPESGTKNP